MYERKKLLFSPIYFSSAMGTVPAPRVCVKKSKNVVAKMFLSTILPQMIRSFKIIFSSHIQPMITSRLKYQGKVALFNDKDLAQ